MSKVYVVGMATGYVASIRADIRGVYTSREDAISYLKENRIYPRGDNTWDDLVHERALNPSKADAYHIQGDLFIYNENSKGFEFDSGLERVINGWLSELKEKESIVDYLGFEMNARIEDFGVESSGYEDEDDDEEICEVRRGCVSVDFYSKEMPLMEEIREFVKLKLSKYNEENRGRWYD